MVKAKTTRASRGINFLLIRHMTPNGNNLLNKFGFDLKKDTFEDRMLDVKLLDALAADVELRNAVKLLHEWIYVDTHSYSASTALWATPGITLVGITALWNLKIRSPEEAKKEYEKAEQEGKRTNNKQYLVDHVRLLFWEANKRIEFTPQEEREVWAGIMMALSYWGSITDPSDVIGPPTTGMKP